MIYRLDRIINISVCVNNSQYSIKLKIFSYTFNFNCKCITLLKQWIIKFYKNSASQSSNEHITKDPCIRNFSSCNNIYLGNYIKFHSTTNRIFENVYRKCWSNTLELLTTSDKNDNCRCNWINNLMITLDKEFSLYLWKLVKILKYDDDSSILMNLYKQSFNNDFMQYQCLYKLPNLSTVLIQRACNNATIAYNFYWFLRVEIEDHKYENQKKYLLYEKILNSFIKKLENSNNYLKNVKANLEKQEKFINELEKILTVVDSEPGGRKKKQEKLQALLSDCNLNFMKFKPFPFILDTNIYVQGIISEKTYLYNSSLMPVKLTFLTTQKNLNYIAIFKRGIDLRQDQIVLEIIKLVDHLLKIDKINLQFTTYKIVPTNLKNGFLQYIESITLTDVLENYGNIQNFFRIHNPCNDAPYAIQSNAMNTYIKSCAGYSIITYLFGIGDRHMDNILLTKNGKLFHVDFSYLFGKDPKPMQPSIKLYTQIIDGMGGIDSKYFFNFRKYCYLAFLCLRRNADIILSSIVLMMDKITNQEIKKIEENLQLNLNDSEALIYIQHLLDKSIHATIPVLVEKIHKIVKYWRE